MAKRKEKCIEQRRKQKRESEQRRRDRIKMDSQLYEEAKRKERERYHRRKNAGKIKSVEDLNEREKRRIRKRWRETSLEYRRRERNHQNMNKFLQEITPPSTPTIEDQHLALMPGISGRSAAGRKRVLRKRSETVRKLKLAEKKLDKFRKKATQYKTKYYRLKKQTIKINTNSPRTKVAELTKGQNITKEVKRQLLFGEVLKSQLQYNYKNLGCSSKKKENFIQHTSGNIIKRYRLINETNKYFGSHKVQKDAPKRILTKVKRKHLNLMQTVKNFYEKDDNSRMCPGKKDTITVNKCKKQKRYLSNSLKALYEKFLSENLESPQISYATFCKLRPFWIIMPTVAKRETCLCIVHENMALLVTKMKLLQIINENNPDDLCKTICCDLQEKCLERKCAVCKDRQVVFKTYQENEHSSYKKWILKNIVINIKNVEKNCKKVIKEDIKCTKGEMVKLLIDFLPKYMLHVSNMKHQFKMIQDLKHKLNPETEVLIHVDFSENYTCKYSREIQSVHFGGSKPQVSLHTVVWYHKDDEDIKPESFCSFSENIRHDAVAIIAHLLPLVKTIKEKMPLLNRVYFWSDGPSTQYRNKTMFQLVGTKLAEILEVEEISWNYFESGHGKGAVDGIGGCLKRTADRLVASGYDIPNIDALLFYLRESCPGIQIECVAEEQIMNYDKLIPFKLKPFKGTMQVHQLCWNMNKPNCVALRRLSCSNCSFETNCSHYGLGNFSIQTNPQPFPAKLNYADVYSDSEDEQPLAHFIKDHELIKTPEPENIQEDDFVLVEWPKGSKIRYIGQVCVIIHEATYDINFMRRLPSIKDNLIFIWPEEQDLTAVNFDCIIKKLKKPRILRRSRFLFKDEPALLGSTLK